MNRGSGSTMSSRKLKTSCSMGSTKRCHGHTPLLESKSIGLYPYCMSHQIVILGDAATDDYRNGLSAEIAQVFNNLGLASANYLEFLNIETKDKINWKLLPVFVWRGQQSSEASSEELEIIIKALNKHLPIFPIVDTTEHYTSKVPECLHPINGAIEQEPPTKLANQIMQVLGLTWSHRRIFISYKRSESIGVAAQLFTELGLKGYTPFLDSASVEGGVDFQESLWHQLADTDLLIFLDSPNAATSEWVEKELKRADTLGISVLQIIWPNHSPIIGMEFCEKLPLEEVSFDGSHKNPSATIKK